MKFVISSNDLLNQLQSLVKVIKSKNTLQALDCFLLSIENRQLTLTASDLDTTISAIVDLDIAEGEGEIGIDARRLLNTVKEFNEPLTFDIDTENLKVDIISSNGKYTLVGINGEEYPTIPRIDEVSSNKIVMPAETLLRAINHTIFAAIDNEARPIMAGVYMGFNSEMMTAAATDTHKLVRYRRKNLSVKQECNFILPNKPASLLKSLLPKDDTSVEIVFDPKNAQIRFSTITFVSRLIEGNYPKFESIIPVNPPFKMIVDRATLQSVLRRVGLYASQSVQLVKFEIAPSELVVSAQDTHFNISAFERIPCSFDGDSMVIGFKSVFLYEILDNLPGEEVLFELSEPSRAVLISPTKSENENEDILSLLMPIYIE